MCPLLYSASVRAYNIFFEDIIHIKFDEDDFKLLRGFGGGQTD